jgi:hypothetical protein
MDPCSQSNYTITLDDPRDTTIVLDYHCENLKVTHWYRRDTQLRHAFDILAEWEDKNYWNDNKRIYDRAVYDFILTCDSPAILDGWYESRNAVPFTPMNGMLYGVDE